MGFYDDPENSGRLPKWAITILQIMIALAIIGWVLKTLYELCVD